MPARSMSLSSNRRRFRASGLSFAALAVSNALVFVDFVVLPNVDLAVYRSLVFCVATLLLVYGLVKDSD
jgi:hypothetical protein